MSNTNNYIEKIAQFCGFIDFVLHDFMEDEWEIVVAGDFNCFANLFLENIGLIKLADLFTQCEVKPSDDLYIGDLENTHLSMKIVMSIPG